MFKTTAIKRWMAPGLVAAALVMAGAREAWAHCDTMSGPVVTAAKNALESGNVDLALIWVEPGDEAAIRAEFTRARTSRAAGGAAQEAADRGFFEALVRFHRAGEGAPYTGIKPAGVEVGPAIAAADEALAARSVNPIRKVLASVVQSGIEKHFSAVLDRMNYGLDDVSAGRAYVKAYVEYTHFAEGLYDLATASNAHQKHATDAPATGHEGHGTTAAGACDAHAGHTGHASHLPWVLVAFLSLTVLGESSWIAWRRRESDVQPSSENERREP